ncbi:hypothetical protein BUE76_01790 [Cnuella takakiae]|nr:hypothetical protein BUE76_01790 [Cnuella takakiae]
MATNKLLPALSHGAAWEQSGRWVGAAPAYVRLMYGLYREKSGSFLQNAVKVTGGIDNAWQVV